jgi:alanyl-tRNA synthetase
VPVIADIFNDDYPEIAENRSEIIDILVKEEKIFRQTLNKGLREFSKFAVNGLTGAELFTLYDTFGFPVELSVEEAQKRNIDLSRDWRNEFDAKMTEQRQRSQTATKGVFKGGLEGHSDMHVKYHTTAHLMGQALRLVLGETVAQRGCNINEERLRFDFGYPEKVMPDKLQQIEDIVNEQIKKDLAVSFAEYPLAEARAMGAYGEFGDKYGDNVRVYEIADKDGTIFSLEICGGPHVSHTGELGRFKIVKEESSSAGVRRIKAILLN